MLEPVQRSRVSQTVRWRRAWRALRNLLRDPDDTSQALNVIFALDSKSFEAAYQCFVNRCPRLNAYVQDRALAEKLTDTGALTALPANSFGRHYLNYIEENRFEPLGFVRASQSALQAWENTHSVTPRDAMRTRFAERQILCHDLWHVLTGYPTNEPGETALLAFSTAQSGSAANYFLSTGATAKLTRVFGTPWLNCMYRAWRRGQRTASLLLFPWEDVLALPLDTVRLMASIDSMQTSHTQSQLVWFNQ